MAWQGYDGKTHFTCAETAKYVRQALKREFPDTKFSVRSRTYAGGASIDVSWTDGPSSFDVNAALRMFSGASFDGMVDLKTYNEHWLEPDGTVVLASAGGQGSTNPEYVGDPPSGKAILVRFGADFVHGQREISAEFRARVIAHVEQNYRLENTTDNRYHENARFGNRWASDLVNTFTYHSASDGPLYMTEWEKRDAEQEVAA